VGSNRKNICPKEKKEVVEEEVGGGGKFLITKMEKENREKKIRPNLKWGACPAQGEPTGKGKKLEAIPEFDETHGGHAFHQSPKQRQEKVPKKSQSRPGG